MTKVDYFRIFSAFLFVIADAFIINQPIPLRKSFIATKLAPGDGLFEENRFDVEAARERFESLLGFDDKSSTKAEGGSNQSLSPSQIRNSFLQEPPLTTMAKERRMAEIHLLTLLETGDDAVPALWDLWFSEQGPQAEMELRQTDDLMASTAQWKEAERRLKRLVAKHGIRWVEPLNRLATLYYLQRRLKQSRTLCELVLSMKPWHFGALSGIVMVCAELGDVESATKWAALRLPTFEPTAPNRRRAVWVQTAVETAQQSLRQAEERVRLSFGNPDQHTYPNPIISDDDDEEDGQAWQ